MYDSMVHASTHDGINKSRASQMVEFKHNDLDSFRSSLLSIRSSSPQIKQKKSSILVAVESVYSTHGDVCPLKEFVSIAKEISNGQGNIQFIIDEARKLLLVSATEQCLMCWLTPNPLDGTGVIGPKGAGLVSQLGLQKEIAVTMHAFTKAMGCAGGKATYQY